MRALLKLVGFAFSFFVLLVILTATVSFIRRAWFGGATPSATQHVRIVEVSGVITSSSALVEEFQEIEKSKLAKAVVVRVNSPGGMVAPSQEIYESLLRLDKKIPVVISMGSVAASGGYYIALGGRTVFANAGTLTGSIGVLMQFVNTQKLYQWAKLERFTLTSGRFKDAGSPLKPMQPEERALFQGMVQDIYRQFRTAVQTRRGLEDGALDKVADGRVLTGSQALEAKLVDKLGSLEDAVDAARALAKLPKDAPAVLREKPQGLLRKLLMGEEDRTESSWGRLADRAAEALPPSATPFSGPSWQVLWLAPVH